MSNKKATFVTIIVLLCIFLPLTVMGYFVSGKFNPLEENPNHDLYYEGSLWFYDENDNFINKYECSTNNCALTKTTIDDDNYHLNYYQDGTLENIPIIDYKYAFITDGNLIHLYDIGSGRVLSDYKAVKDYHTEIENNIYILQNNDNSWGALTINNNMLRVLPFEYDFIGLANNKNTNVLDAKTFTVLKDNNWYLVDNNNSAICGYIPLPIVDYNANFIVAKDDEKVRIYDYADNEYFQDLNILNYARVDNYLGLITEENLYIYDGLSQNYLKMLPITSSNSKITLTIEEDKLNILNEDEIMDTIEL